MTQTTSITVRTPIDTKRQAQQYFESLGVSMSSAINLFLKHVVSNQSLSFSISSEEPYGMLYEVDRASLPDDVRASLERVERLKPSDFYIITADDYENH